MSTNIEPCPYIRASHIGVAQSGYSASLLGYGNAKQMEVERRDEIKSVCLKCKAEECVYERREDG